MSSILIQVKKLKMRGYSSILNSRKSHSKTSTGDHLSGNFYPKKGHAESLNIEMMLT